MKNMKNYHKMPLIDYLVMKDNQILKNLVQKNFKIQNIKYNNVYKILK